VSRAPGCLECWQLLLWGTLPLRRFLLPLHNVLVSCSNPAVMAQRASEPIADSMDLYKIQLTHISSNHLPYRRSTACNPGQLNMKDEKPPRTRSKVSDTLSTLSLALFGWHFWPVQQSGSRSMLLLLHGVSSKSSGLSTCPNHLLIHLQRTTYKMITTAFQSLVL